MTTDSPRMATRWWEFTIAYATLIVTLASGAWFWILSPTLGLIWLFGVLLSGTTTASLWVGLNLVKRPSSIRECAITALFRMLLNCVVGVFYLLCLLYLPNEQLLNVIILVIELTKFLLWKRYWGLSSRKYAVVMLFLVIDTVCCIAFILYVSRPYLFQFFFTLTMNMAPTLACEHDVYQCPYCQGKGFSKPETSKSFFKIGVCEQCLKGSEEFKPILQNQPADRFIVDKLKKWKRWDMIAFKNPKNGELYVSRLVGLPGEQVEIRDGVLYINGQVQTPPSEISRLEYTLPANATSLFELNDQQAVILGDCTMASNDSRFEGPIQITDITGVVTIRYFPLSRWKIWK